MFKMKVKTKFGGYRKNDFDAVLSLHTADLVQCLHTLCGQDVKYFF